MKKKLVSFIVFLVLVLNLLTGCTLNQKQDEVTEIRDVQEADLIIVGGGGAGLSAAMTAAEKGLDVIVLEKMPFVGGNMVISAGIIQAAGTSVQREFGIEGDTPEKFMNDLTITDSPYKNPQRPLSTIMHEGSRDIVDELVERGLEFAGFDEVNHRQQFVAPFGNGAPKLVQLLKETAVSAGATILVNTEVTELITDEDRVVGVIAKQGDKEGIAFRGKAVILATGGFAANQEMVAQYMPQFAGLPTWAQPGTTGDGIHMAEKIGAATVAMDAGMHVALINPDTNYYTNPRRGILVNTDGARFYDETTLLYSEMAKATSDQPERRGYVVIDEKLLKENGADYNIYIERGVAKSANSLEELANKLNMSKLVDTVNSYNAMVLAGEDKEFERTFQLNTLTPGDRFYAIQVVPHPYNTYGGIQIDTKTRVLNNKGEIIPGLYAAGEVCGSIEVQEGLEYTTGNGQALVFGRLAVETFLEDTK